MKLKCLCYQTTIKLKLQQKLSLSHVKKVIILFLRQMPDNFWGLKAVTNLSSGFCEIPRSPVLNLRLISSICS